MTVLSPALPVIDAARPHRPVMLVPAIQALRLTGPDAVEHPIVMDGTFGRGGHSQAILDALAGRGVLHAMDQDPEAAAYAQQRFGTTANFVFHFGNFGELTHIAQGSGILGRINALLLDVGVSSPQLDDPERGFSFSHDGPLDMRMNPTAGRSAAEWLAVADPEEIANVLFEYGDERNSRRIARKIAEARIQTPILRTAQLAALIASVPGPRSHKIHPATRSFQAIRIYINRELDVLQQVLEAAITVLAPGGRLAVISFHSLEDRIVKRFMRQFAGGRAAHNKYAHLTAHVEDAESAPVLRELGRSFADDQEVAENPRARSAVLRVAEKTTGVGA